MREHTMRTCLSLHKVSFRCSFFPSYVVDCTRQIYILKRVVLQDSYPRSFRPTRSKNGAIFTLRTLLSI